MASAEHTDAPGALKPLDECLYYMVREMGGLGAKAKPEFFDDALEHIRMGVAELRGIEMHALSIAAEQRGRWQDLKETVEAGAAALAARKGKCAGCAHHIDGRCALDGNLLYQALREDIKARRGRTIGVDYECPYWSDRGVATDAETETRLTL